MQQLPTITEEYLHLFREGPLTMYIYDDAAETFLAVNNTALCQYGYSHEEFLTLRLSDIQPVEEQDTLIQQPEFVPGMYTSSGRLRHRRKNGEIFYVQSYSHQTIFEQRTAILFLAIDVDQTEKALEIENILDSITDAFYTINHRWQFTHVNKAYEKLLGRKREDMIGGNIWELFPYGREFSYYDRYHQVVKDQVSVHFEEYIPINNSWVSVNAYPTTEGLAVYMVDISEQRQLRETIYTNEQNLRAIINNTTDLIWLVNTDFKIISANRAFRDRMAGITGRAKDKLADADYPADLLVIWNAYYRQAMEGNSFKIIWTDTKDGNPIYEEVSFNPVFDQQDKVSAISCFSRDITEARIDQERILRQNQQLRKIAWIQSHEVRSPLANIMGLVQLLTATDMPGEEFLNMLSMLKTSADQLNQVIFDIMTHADNHDDVAD